MMGNIISIAVVIVFLLIVFRKRLAPLFKGNKGSEDVHASDTLSVEEPAEKLPGYVYCDVLVFNLMGLDPDLDVAEMEEVFNSRLISRLQLINMKGSIEKIESRINNDVLFVFITWKLLTV